MQIASEVSISHERVINMSQPTADVVNRRGDTCVPKHRHRRDTPRQRQRFHRRRMAERPAIVESRKRADDQEGHTIEGKRLTRIVTLVERKSGLLRVVPVRDGEVDTVMRAVIHILHLAPCTRCRLTCTH